MLFEGWLEMSVEGILYISLSVSICHSDAFYVWQSVDTEHNVIGNNTSP